MSLQKESEGKLITAMGMMAENMQRQALGESMAYTENDFIKLLEDHKCGGELCIVCGYREKIKESPMTEPNMEWEEELNKERKNPSYTFVTPGSHINWDGIESFIRKVETQAYEKGAAEERERIAAVAKKINKLVRGEWEWKLYCNSTGMAMSQKQANELINELINIHDTK